MRAPSKRSVSLRIDEADFDKIRGIAQRLHARDSDVFRFAVKLLLERLAPLYDTRLAGADLMPVFVECGAELIKHFNLDSKRLSRIVNGDVDDAARRVEYEDIELLAMTNMPDRYLYPRLRDVARKPVDPHTVAAALRDYFNDKYVDCSDEYRRPEAGQASG